LKEKFIIAVFQKLIRDCRTGMNGKLPSSRLWLQNAYAINYYIKEIRELRKEG
jgi:hypothetical protein